MTTVETTGIALLWKYKDDPDLSLAYYILMGLAIIPATWFQFTLLKWMFFVCKYVRIRERRVRMLLARME